MRIKTFEELCEEVKKLYPDLNKLGINYAQIKNENLNFTFYFNDCLSPKDWTTLIRYNLSFILAIKEIKDPQKIYNVLKAIKECEDD